MNILNDALNPKTFGELVDALIITNIRMWHVQEIIYEPKTLDSLSRDGMFAFLKEATWLNLRRNHAMDKLDNSLAEQIIAKYPNIERRDQPILMEGQSPIWEEV